MVDRTHPRTVIARPGRPPILTRVSNAPPAGRPVLAFTLPGVAYDDDIAVQAFARHLTAAVEAGGGNGRRIVAGMRAFLEGKPDLLPDPPWSVPPATGERAVEHLAVAAGCPPDLVVRARTAARQDLARTAWLLDPADGLSDLLDAAAGRARVVAVADPADPATVPILDALELTERVALVAPADLDALPAGSMVLIDATWAPHLARAQANGQRTVLIDRFGAGDGRPDRRTKDLRGAVPDIAAWLEGTAA